MSINYDYTRAIGAIAKSISDLATQQEIKNLLQLAEQDAVAHDRAIQMARGKLGIRT